jgi:glycosyl transferase family 2
VIILSILTPAVPSRIDNNLSWLCGKIGRQIGAKPVEHLVLIDNKRRTVGEKRDSLLRAARGEYVAFVDDDDDVSDDYVDAILTAAVRKPDVITFRQRASVDGKKAEVEFRLGNENEPFVEGATFKRNAWHVCAWRRTLAIQSHFPAINYGEDWAFVAPLCAAAKSEVHVARVLHFYRHTSETTQAPFRLY